MRPGLHLKRRWECDSLIGRTFRATKGRSAMAPLDTTTFVIVLVAAISVMGAVIGLRFHAEKKKGR